MTTSARTIKPTLRLALPAALLFAAMVAWRYGSLPESWWWKDDATILIHAIDTPVLQNFWVPSVWRSLSVVNLTPWVCLIFDLDFRLFGFDPHAHYLHHLAMLAGCAVMLALVARHWVDSLHALAAGLLFLAGAPVAVAAMQLMTRHYVEGLFYFLLALSLYLRSLKSGTLAPALLASFALAVAVTAKELYLPLGLVPLLLPLATWRQRLAAAWPMLSVMAVYPIWRLYMLGGTLGGYAPADSYAETRLLNTLKQFGEIPSLLTGNLGLVQVLIAVIPVFTILMSPRPCRTHLCLLLIATSVLLLGPLLPLALIGAFHDFESQRFLFALWAAVALALAVSMGSVVRTKTYTWRLASLMILSIIGFAATNQASTAMTALAPLRAEYLTQGRAIMTAQPNDLLFLTPAVANWYARDVGEIRRRTRPDSPAPLLIADESALASRFAEDIRVLRYQTGRADLEDITPQVPALLDTWRSRVRRQPLTVDVSYDPANHAIHAVFGPDSGGGYRAMKSASFVMDVPAELRTRTGASWTESCLVIRHCTPDGFLVYSPPLQFSGTSAGMLEIHWRGDGVNPTEAFQEHCPRRGTAPPQ